MSQLLHRLERERNACEDPVGRAELAAKVAANLARVGRFDEARRDIRELREHFGSGQSGRATVWIMLAEGLVHLFEKLSPQALDRISRAQTLALAMGYSEVIALSSAWKAHLEFEAADFDLMYRSLTLARQNIEPTHHDAQTRLAIVMTNAFTFLGDTSRSQEWFDLARRHAIANGDQASIEAILYNRAAFSLSWARVENCKGSIERETLTRIRVETDSSRNLQGLTQNAAFDNHVYLVDARLKILEGDYAGAITGLQSLRGRAPFASYNFEQSYLILELGFCQLMLGDLESALQNHSQISTLFFDDLDLDERVVIAWMMERMSSADPRFGDHEKLAGDLRQLLLEYENYQLHLRRVVDQFVNQSQSFIGDQLRSQSQSAQSTNSQKYE